MSNWPKWIWPGLVTTALLTALSAWFLSGPVEQDLAVRSGQELTAKGFPWATVSFSGRDAVLSGVSEGEGAQSSAAETVLNTYGVRVVANQSTLPQKADPFAFSAIKNAEGVSLKGNFAASKAHAEFVASVEKSMPGIAVKDEMTLAAGKPEGFDDLAAFAIAQLADLTAGEIAVSNLDYSIKGDPVDIDTYSRLNEALAAPLPAAGALKSAELSLPALGAPYPFSASLDGNAIKLEGYAPSVEAKNSIESKATELFSGKSVNSLLKLAGGAPVGFADLVNFGLSQLQTLGNGSFALNDLNYTLKGTPADQAAYDALSSGAKSLPAGAKVAALDLVEPPKPAPAPEPVKPYTWSATSKAGAVVADGDVSSQESAPEGYAAVQSTLLAALSKLKDGSASMQDMNVAFTGTADSDATKSAIEVDLRTGLPQDYRLEFNVSVEAPLVVAPVAEPAPLPQSHACLADVQELLKSSEILFRIDSATIDPASHGLLDQIITALSKCPEAKVEISGHTDSDGEEAYNLDLSNQRAVAVRDYLAKVVSSGNRLTAKGYGESQPLATNDTPENKAKNRRIEFRPVL